MFDIANISIAAAFLAGVVSFLSPCVLPLVPGYFSYVVGRSLENVSAKNGWSSRFRVLGLSLYFVLGFSVVFMALGATATALGQTLLRYQYEAGIVAGIVILLFGLHMMGVLRLSWLNRDWHFGQSMAGGTPLGAFILGTSFAFGWTPCIGPILGAILTLSATTASVQQGVLLLGVYSLGLAVPFLLLATFTGSVIGRFRKLGPSGRFLHKASGSVLAMVGVAMMTGTLNTAGTWLLETFPAFQDLII